MMFVPEPVRWYGAALKSEISWRELEIFHKLRLIQYGLHVFPAATAIRLPWVQDDHFEVGELIHVTFEIPATEADHIVSEEAEPGGICHELLDQSGYTDEIQDKQTNADVQNSH